MLIVGLTGGIGSGKTLVSELFAHIGIPIYNADRRAKELMSAPEIVSLIKLEFGEEVFSKGILDRTKLAHIVFSDKEKLHKLNAIVHPAVRLDHEIWHSKQKAKYTIKEAAILFESGSYKDCDVIIAISAPVELRIKRVMNRDGVTREDVLARIKNQWSDEQRAKASDFVILNDGIEMLLPQVLQIHEELLKMEII